MNLSLYAQPVSLGLLGLLTWTTPYVAFASSSIEWFNRRQFWGGFFLAAVLGSLSGLGFIWLGSEFAPAVSGLVVGLLSEKLISAFARKWLAKSLTIVFIVIFFYGASYFLGPWAVCGLLFFWLFASLRDLAKNRLKPKKSIPPSPKAGTTPIHISSSQPPAEMPSRPDIHFLFLESIHSAKAMRMLFDHDDDSITEFFEKNGFTIFPNAHSNEFGTTYSLNTLLHMDSAGYTETAHAPPVFQWLHANGYKINLIDCASFTFSHYVLWANTFNYSMPDWIKFLYAWALPFFMQSSWLNALTKNIDPFTDEADFEKARHDFLQLPKTSEPSFNLIRFGANHTPPGYDLKDRESFAATYLNLHEKTAHDIRELASQIIKANPNAVIIAMGDHGSASLANVWVGKKTANENIRARGFEPAQITEDLTGILLAVRFPDAFQGDAEKPISPANLFRLIFQYCGVPEKDLPPASPDDSYLHPTNSQHPFLLIQNGEILKDWVHYTPQEILKRVDPANLQNDPASTPKALKVGKALMEAGKFKDAMLLWEKALQNSGFNSELAKQLAWLYLRMGKPQKVLALLEDHFQESGDLLKPYVRALALTGFGSQAGRILELEGARLHLSPLDLKEQLALSAQTAGDMEMFEIRRKELANAHYDEYWLKDCAVFNYACLLSSLGKDAEALAYLQSFLASANIRDSRLSQTLKAALATSLRAENWELFNELSQRSFKISSQPYPATLYLWQAGGLERQNRLDEALDALRSAVDLYGHIPLLKAQAGLFCIRHQLRDPKFLDARKQAYAYLRESSWMKPFFDEAFYVGHYGDKIAATGFSPFEHFLHYGRLSSLDPRQEFNNAYYCLVNADIFQNGYDPFWHFLTCPPYEGRNPSPIFLLSSYMAKHPEVDWSSQNPLVHYCLGKQS